MGQNTVAVDDEFESAFSRECAALLQSFCEMVAALQDPQVLLDDHDDPVYVKALDGQVVFSNSAFQDVFAGAQAAVGRFSKTFLTDSIAPVSNLSDEMIGAGCARVEFEHAGTDVQGRSVLLRSFKSSLKDVGQPRMAVFGVTRVMKAGEPAASVRAKELWDQCQAYQQLSPTACEVAIMLIRGVEPNKIAASLQIDSEAVDVHRQEIFQRLGIRNSQQLVMLMVRLQDSGYIDVGI